MEPDSQVASQEQIKSAERILEVLKQVYPNEDVTGDGEASENAVCTIDTVSPIALLERAEKFLRAKEEHGDMQARFLLGQIHFEKHQYEEAFRAFDSIKDQDVQALYQLAVMHFDGLGTRADPGLAVEYMKRVALSDEHVKYAALYNIGQAYLQGHGVKPSDSQTERYWLQAAADGNPNACIKAQTALGMFYSRPESLDLKKAFFWHSEACGNGSLESQGALGIMYLHGKGISKSMESAIYCLKGAAERGNVYAQGHLVACYYQSKVYAKAVALAQKIIEYKDIQAIAKTTGCLPEFVAKGIAIALFHYGRCLQLGIGISQDKAQAELYYAKAVKMDAEVSKEIQMAITLGKI
ncbi:LRP2-binding protein [Engraulis encrasicolus]|uniref:LRP2-binding protein n=1 Tax=Engraulis encrasicolus TaxID=184585 RepID=UPI002FD516CD